VTGGISDGLSSKTLVNGDGKAFLTELKQVWQEHLNETDLSYELNVNGKIVEGA
jgi:hypothetical protein